MHNVIHLHNKLQMIRQQVFTFSFTCPGFVVLVFSVIFTVKCIFPSSWRLAGNALLALTGLMATTATVTTNWELVNRRIKPPNLLDWTRHPLCKAGLLSWLLMGHVSQREVDSRLRIHLSSRITKITSRSSVRLQSMTSHFSFQRSCFRSPTKPGQFWCRREMELRSMTQAGAWHAYSFLVAGTGGTGRWEERV